MNVIGVVSMKGGVGKTTLTANLAAAFDRRGHRVAVVDMDPQNGLAWHFADDNRNLPGIIQSALQGKGIGEGWAVPHTGIRIFPYGRSEEHERLAFEDLLRSRPQGLAARVARLSKRFDIVLIDSPPGHSIYLQQVLQAAHHLLAVLLPDLASLATVNDMEEVVAQTQARRPELRCHYLINQFEAGDPLAADLVNMLVTRFGSRLLPMMIHRDESVPEALAVHRVVRSYAPNSQAGRDLDLLTTRLERMFER